MHIYNLKNWQHSHNYALDGRQGERKTLWVVFLTTTMMVAEIIVGMSSGSMALLADGWHMATHVAAFSITLFAYRYARKYSKTSKFTFGPGKVTVLGGFASAIALGVVAFMMAIESVLRLITPQTIHFNQAIVVAVVGLLVNGLSAVILNHGHDHPCDHEDSSETVHQTHHDHNLKAAYFHVLADALTSVLAIVGLLSAKYFHWIFMDAVMGIVGSLVITRWALGLLKETSPILLDGEIEEDLKDKIRQAIEGDADNRISDFHIWKVSPHHIASIISVVTHYPKEVAHYKQLLRDIKQLSHVTIEVYQGEGRPCFQVDPL